MAGFQAPSLAGFERPLTASDYSRQMTQNLTQETEEKGNWDTYQTGNWNDVLDAWEKADEDDSNNVTAAATDAKNEAAKALKDVKTRYATVQDAYSDASIAVAVAAAVRQAYNDHQALQTQLDQMLANSDFDDPEQRSFWVQRSYDVGSALTNLFNSTLNTSTNFFAGWAQGLTGASTAG